ncbi:MAG: hypothetical protein EBS72_07850, partial [Rhizobiales bacterium]|nr:hypothetical protein [Hyphomicrobiales bacterium]
MINAVADERGVDGVMIPFHVAPADLPALVKGLKGMKSLGGFVVTVPHKGAIVDLLDEVSPSARLIGAANCVRREADGRLVGEMLDGVGFVTGLRQAGIEPKGLSAYLAGAGGAANAIAFALIEAGVTRLTIANRTREKVDDLIARLSSIYPDADLRIGGPGARGLESTQPAQVERAQARAGGFEMRGESVGALEQRIGGGRLLGGGTVADHDAGA